MEEENKTEGENNQDVSIEEVNKVIEGDDELDEDDSNPKGDYIDLTEEDAKKELDTMIVPGSEDNSSLKKPQPINPVPMSLLQFECGECNFKSYVNMDDENISPLPKKIKCLNCGKKKSVKKRTLSIVLNGFTEYEEEPEKEEEPGKKEEPEIDPELKQE